jgi:hypothetical protein
VYPSQRVDVLLSDLANGQVVFQSLATGNSGASAATLLEAALRDFPNVPPGTRLVPLSGPMGILKPDCPNENAPSSTSHSTPEGSCATVADV